MSLQPKFLKIVQAGYESYTGPIGAYEFEDGRSTVMIPRNDRDRLATAFQFVEYVEEGVDEIEAGVAARLLREGNALAVEMRQLERQTEEEKAAEDNAVVRQNEPVPVFHSREELEAIADKKGINGLREIAEGWKVKHRSILPLIGLILNAQEVWLAEHQAAFEARGLSRAEFEASLKPAPVAAPVEKPETATPDAAETEESHDDPVPEEIKSPEITDEELLKQAAASGDVSAAVSQE